MIEDAPICTCCGKPVPSDKIDLINQLRHDDGKGASLIPEIALPLLERWHTTPGALPLSSVLCTAVLGKPVPAALWSAQAAKTAADSDRTDHTKWAWSPTAIERLEPSQPAKGLQGFWKWRASDG